MGGITNAELISFDEEERKKAKGTDPYNGPREKIRNRDVGLMVAVEYDGQVGDGDGTSSKELTSTLKPTGGDRRTVLSVHPLSV